jgi:hypothetical protein
MAREALARLLEPISAFALVSGIGTAELNTMLREASVRSARKRQLQMTNRINISGIAASTGIPRADISRILNAKTNSLKKHEPSNQQPTNAIIGAWRTDSRYIRPNGRPADLKMYGRDRSFESLAKSHGRGIAARAILEELMLMGAVEIRSSQLIRLTSSVAAKRKITSQSMVGFGKIGGEFLSDLLANMRVTATSKFTTGSNASLKEQSHQRRRNFRRVK